MGRSQVLYNRTKGRYKNRGTAGGGGGRTGRGEPNPGRGGGGGGRGIRSQPQAQQQQYPPDPPTTTTKQRRTPKYDESFLLEPPTRIYKTAVVDDVELSTIGGSGSIDVRSMAAAFTTSLTLSQRLFIPQHIAQVLESAAVTAISAEDNSDVVHADNNTKDDNLSLMSPVGTNQSEMSPVQRIKQRQLLKNSLLKSPPSSPRSDKGNMSDDDGIDNERYATPVAVAGGGDVDITKDMDHDDDLPVSASYSVDTRRPTKVRVNPDGQVEVRNKTTHQRKEPPIDPPSPGAPIPPTIVEDQNSNNEDGFDDVLDDIDGLIFSGVGQGAIAGNNSPTGLLKDRYMVLEADYDGDEDNGTYEQPQDESKRTIRNVPTDENRKEESRRTIHNVPTDERYLSAESSTHPHHHVSPNRGGNGKPSLAIKTTDLEDDSEESTSIPPHTTSNKKPTPASAAVAASATRNKNASSLTPVHKNHSKYSTPNNKAATATTNTITTKKKAGKKGTPKIKESESMLDDWLDQAMKSVSNDDGDFPSLPDTIVRAVHHEYITRSEEDDELHNDESYDETTTDTSTVSSITQSTLTQSYVDTSTTVTSRCYTHDSRGKLFEDIDGEDGTILEENEDESTTLQYTEPTTKSTQKKSKTPRQSKSSKKSSKQKEENDLDDWLDSVIS